MENSTAGASGPFVHDIRIEEVHQPTPEHIRTLIDIDLKTFSEPTFSRYTAAVLLQSAGVWFLYTGDRCIGSCVCMRDWERPGNVVLFSMGIRPGFRGRGMGQRFLAEVVAHLEKRGLRTLTLTVGASNRRALKLYESYGFERVDSFAHDERTGDRSIVLRRTLTGGPVLAELVPAPSTHAGQ